MQASARLNAVWKSATARALSGSRIASRRPIGWRIASPMTTPTARLMRLPTGRRLATGSFPDAPSRTGLIAEPRLTPRTRAMAASGGTTPLLARHDDQNHGDARMNRPGHAGRHQDGEKRRGRNGAQQYSQAGFVLILRHQLQQLMQREQRQAEADKDATEVMGLRIGAATKHQDADQDEDRRCRGDVERENLDDKGCADVGA